MLIPDLGKFDVASIDVETTGLDWREDRVFGIAMSTPDGKDYYWDTRRHPHIVDELRRELPKTKLVNHNMKFDVHMIRETFGIKLDLSPDKIDCTMVRAALIDEHLMSYSLDNVAKKYLKREKDDSIYQELADLFGGKPTRSIQMQNISKAPEAVVARYAKVDSRLALDLWMWQEKEIERQGIQRIAEFERQLFPYVMDMEYQGVRIDVRRAEILYDKLGKDLEVIQKNLDKLAGFPVNPNPSKSIQRLFAPKKDSSGRWVAIDGTILPSTDGGKPSIGADQLRAMKHPAATLVLQARKLDKTRETFLKSHVLERVKNGRVHPNINQTKGDSGSGTEGTGTGRLSYTQPALQQIPSRDVEVAQVVRPIFLPDEGQRWSYGDLDQHEFRIFIHYAKPEAILQAYRDNPNLDVHQIVADLTGLPRNAKQSGGANAKQMNLGMVFSMGGGTLAEKMGLPYTEQTMRIKGEDRVIKVAGEEAEEVIAKYHEKVHGVRETAKKASSIAKSRGYVQTLMGRHIRFPRGEFVHKAAGLVYQGSSADLNKSNMMRLQDVLAPAGGRLILNIHDEYSMSIPEMSDKKTKELLVECQRVVQDRPELRVPIRIDFSKPSANWWAATKADKWT